MPFLFSDKVGVRQLFVAEQEDFVAFSTSLRVLEELSILPKKLDYAGLTEQAELHWPVGRRTPYQGISLLEGAEVLYMGQELSSETYWSWPQTADRALSTEDHLQNCYEEFQNALRARLAGDTDILAFLSGGLDSRTVVTGLSNLGMKVHAVNYAPEGTQDRVYAERFAKVVGCDYLQMPFSPDLADSGNVHTAVRRFVLERHRAGELSLDRPNCIWTGNGGSVGLGHVYMNEGVVRALDGGRVDEALKHYRKTERTDLTRKPLNKEVFQQYRKWPFTSLKDDLQRFEAEEPGRAFYFFLMANDQRRSLHGVFEDIDLHQLEFIMPFFDSDFLEAVAKVPIDECLYHRFYVRWIRCFGEAVSAVPWQSYPGHVPCPIEDDPSLGYQFDSDYSSAWSNAKTAIRLRKAREMVTSKSFPHHILSRSSIALAYVLGLARSKRLTYAIEKGYEYFRYWKVAADQG